MDYEQMRRLGKCLIELSGVVAGAPGDHLLTLGEAAVLEDAMEHPGTSIREVHQRSGFAKATCPHRWCGLRSAGSSPRSLTLLAGGQRLPGAPEPTCSQPMMR
jgi:hypothetical protein